MNKAVPQKIFFLLFAGIPLWFSVGHYPNYIRALQSKHYAPATCTIIENERDKISPDDSRQRLRYSYTYGDATYTGTSYRADMEGYSNNRRFVDKTFRKKKAGETVPCFINPAKPSDSVIVPGPVTPWYHMFFLSLLLIAGLWGLFMAFFRPDWAEKNMIMDGDSSGCD